MSRVEVRGKEQVGGALHENNLGVEISRETDTAVSLKHHCGGSVVHGGRQAVTIAMLP